MPANAGPQHRRVVAMQPTKATSLRVQAPSLIVLLRQQTELPSQVRVGPLVKAAVSGTVRASRCGAILSSLASWAGDATMRTKTASSAMWRRSHPSGGVGSTAGCADTGMASLVPYGFVHGYSHGSRYGPINQGDVKLHRYDPRTRSCSSPIATRCCCPRVSAPCPDRLPALPRNRRPPVAGPHVSCVALCCGLRSLGLLLPGDTVFPPQEPPQPPE